MKLILQIAVLVQCLALLVWVGGIFFFAFVAAPLIFQEPVREITGGTHVPGMIVSAILGRFTWIETACAALVLLAVAEQLRQTRDRRGRVLVQLALALAMAGVLLWYGWILGPRMEGLREVIGNFNTAPATLPARAEFLRLHSLYSALMGFNLLVGLALFAFTVALIPSVFRDRDRSVLRSVPV